MDSTNREANFGPNGKASARKTRILSVAALVLAACAFGAAGVVPLAPDAADLPVKSLSQELPLPDIAGQIDALAQADQSYAHETKVRSGDTLATLLHRLGVGDEAAAAFIKTDKTARRVMQLPAERKVQAQTNGDGDLLWLRTTLAEGKDKPVRNLLVQREGDSFSASEVGATLERRIEMHSGEIRSSLFAATDTANIPVQVSEQLVDMFSTNIDFASDLRRGDRFTIVYETFWQDGEFVRSGRVLAGEFKNSGKTYQSVWFEDPATQERGGYYTFDGKALKKAFLKSPLEFSRISSGFAMRVHPISGQWKAHRGVDFAAAAGTPIRASADGTVDFVGNSGGYGNMVQIKHWSNISTAYAHMSRFAPGVRKGSKVSQGDVIGYVGSTGWSTGPHLHYEFRVGNEPRNPLSVVVPETQPLTGADMVRFRAVSGVMAHRFALLRPEERLLHVAMK